MIVCVKDKGDKNNKLKEKWAQKIYLNIKTENNEKKFFTEKFVQSRKML